MALEIRPDSTAGAINDEVMVVDVFEDGHTWRASFRERADADLFVRMRDAAYAKSRQMGRTIAIQLNDDGIGLFQRDTEIIESWENRTGLKIKITLERVADKPQIVTASPAAQTSASDDPACESDERT